MKNLINKRRAQAASQRGALDLDTLTDAGTDFGVAIGVAGGLYLVALVATQTFPFIGAWVKRLRGAASGR